jgi:hypothetical protein
MLFILVFLKPKKWHVEESGKTKKYPSHQKDSPMYKNMSNFPCIADFPYAYILSRDSVTRDGFWIDDRIYWTL